MKFDVIVYDMEFEDLIPDPPGSLRQAQKELTRTRILEKALELLRVGGEEAVTMRAVAARARIAERHIYRHFKTRDVLLQAIWKWLGERVKPGPPPQTAAALVERPRRLFPRFDDEPELVRAFVRSRDKREIPLEDKQALQEAMFKCVRDGVELDHRTARWRAAIAHILSSPYAWELMERYWGFDGEEAGEAAAEALAVLLDRRLAY